MPPHINNRNHACMQLVASIYSLCSHAPNARLMAAPFISHIHVIFYRVRNPCINLGPGVMSSASIRINTVLHTTITKFNVNNLNSLFTLFKCIFSSYH